MYCMSIIVLLRPPASTELQIADTHPDIILLYELIHLRIHFPVRDDDSYPGSEAAMQHHACSTMIHGGWDDGFMLGRGTLFTPHVYVDWLFPQILTRFFNLTQISHSYIVFLSVYLRQFGYCH